MIVKFSDWLDHKDWLRKNYTGPNNILLPKDSQFYSDLADILACLFTQWLIIFTEFEEDRNTIVDFLLVV